MNLLLDWLVRNSLTLGTVLIALLLLRRPLARWLGAEHAYALWLLIPLHLLGGLLLPPTLSMAQLSLPSLSLPAGLSAGSGPADAGFDVALLFGILWLGGMLIGFARLGIEVSRVQTLCRTARPGLHGALYNAAIRGPLLAGWLRPRLLLPADFGQRYSRREQILILRHEHCHRRRRDNLANLLMRGLVCVFWFHPLVHYAQRAFRLDQELACDALVLRRRGLRERQAYGRALVKSAVTTEPVPVASSWQRQTLLKERIMQITRHRPKPARTLLAGALLAPLLAVGALALTSTVQAGDSAAVQIPPGSVIPVKRVNPQYPAKAAAEKIEGVVKLQFVIDTDGSVRDIKVLESRPAGVFDRVAVEAIAQWKFEPVRVDGKPRSATVEQALYFKL